MSPKEQLRLIAADLYAAAVDAHAEGMDLLQRSTRIEQLARMCNDEQAQKLVDELRKEAEGGPSVVLTNSSGGDA